MATDAFWFMRRSCPECGGVVPNVAEHPLLGHLVRTLRHEGYDQAAVLANDLDTADAAQLVRAVLSDALDFFGRQIDRSPVARRALDERTVRLEIRDRPGIAADLRCSDAGCVVGAAGDGPPDVRFGFESVVDALAVATQVHSLEEAGALGALHVVGDIHVAMALAQFVRWPTLT